MLLILVSNTNASASRSQPQHRNCPTWMVKHRADFDFECRPNLGNTTFSIESRYAFDVSAALDWRI